MLKRCFPFPGELNAAGANRLFVVFILSALLIMVVWVSENRRKHRALWSLPREAAPGSYLRTTPRKEQGKRMHHCTATKYSMLWPSLNQHKFIHQERNAN